VNAVYFSFSEEQEQLRASVRRFLVARSPESAVRRTMETAAGHDPAVWEQLSDQLGLTALAVPEKFGGAGFGMVEIGLVLQEMGRALLCAPFLSSAVLATSALISSGDVAACERWLPDLASGVRLGTVALAPLTAAAAVHDVRAERVTGGWLLTGHAGYVLDGHIADVVLIPVERGGAVSLFAVDTSAARVERRLLDTFDATRKLADLDFADTPAVLVGAEGAARAALSRTANLAVVALAAENVGVAERALEMATEYAKVRQQFGRPIGSFQAIKHKLATVLLEVEAARSAAWYAMWAAAERPDELPAVASLTAATCAESAYLATAENIQIHGGMGFTWEHPAHLYFRRATTSRVLFGDPDKHRADLLSRIGYPPGSESS